ncbi:nSTAND1 domain-containing NTPase [Hyalangium versicolor]|uniref:nSTAND1 domain-containing NTPase n=1 Tax=Hyalangium versicolor TaxID=2861190 RepID=UPI001CC90EAD|nr:TIR domain-containing protein [Hyalangium versicolor]
MFDVFLCHSSQDKPVVEALAWKLKSETKLQPFLDKWSLVPGEAWQPSLEDALTESQSVAVFFGPQGLSPWSHEEMRLALASAVRTRDEYRVIPVLLPGARREDVTGFLAQRTWVDFRNGLDDTVAFKRLVAGIQGQAPEHDTYQLPDEPAPYRGLLPFESEHARFFFGREREIQTVLDKLGQNPFVAVVGASGVGKSSLVLSGVLPRLERPGSGFSPRLWIRRMTPGDRPLRALANQLATRAPPESRLATAEWLVHQMTSSAKGFRTAVATLTADQPGPFVLVVDQFEELFTYGEAGMPSKGAAAFLANLRDAVEQGCGMLRILITLRADFFERCLALPPLRELLQDHQVLLGTMGDEALRDAIVCPAQVVGAFLEKGLVSAILKDLVHGLGTLPLLEHALYELWRARNGVWLTLSAYEASGGVTGALQRRAQSTYETLRPEEQDLARKIFLRLTALGEGTPDTSRRIARGELVFPGTAPEQVEHVLRVLSGPKARLLVAGEKTVEVAHEVLILEWNTLRSWVRVNRREFQIHQRLTEAANEWATHRRDTSYLYTGSRLLEAEELFALELTSRKPARLNQREHDFLVASLEHRDEQKRSEKHRFHEELERARQLTRTESERARAARRATQRLRMLVVVLLLASTGILIFLGMARHQQRLALSRELTLNALENLENDPQLSLLLTQQAGRLAMTDQVAEALAAWRSKPGRMILRGHKLGMTSASFSPDGTTIVTSSDDGTARLWDMATGQSIAVLSKHDGTVMSADFSPDGTKVVTAGSDGTALLWDVATDQPTTVLSGHQGAVVSASFSPDGTKIVTAGNDGTARLWDVATGQSTAVLSGHRGPVLSANFSSDGMKIVTAGADGTARLWDVATRKPFAVISGHAGVRLNSASFSPDGATLVTAGSDGLARLWDVATGRSTAVLSKHQGFVASASFSPDGTKVVTAGNDGMARLWDVATSQPTAVLSGHQGPVMSAHFSPNGTTIVTAGFDCTARLWDVATDKSMTVLSGHDGTLMSASFSPDGATLVTAGNDGTARLWDAATGQSLAVFSGNQEPVMSASFSPDGTKIVTAGNDGTARLWHTATRRPLAVLSGHQGWIWSASFSPDGTRVVTAGSDGTTRLWDVTTGQPTAVFFGHQGPVLSANFSSDGTRIVTAGFDGTARLWDVATRRTLAVLSEDEGLLTSASFSPDNTKIVTSGDEGTARLWNVATGKSTPIHSGHKGMLASASFSPDGTKIVTAGFDGTARLWEVTTGRLISVLFEHQGSVISASFSPDGTKIVTAGSDGTAYIWSERLWAPFEDQLASLDAGRSLTPEECWKYLHTRRASCFSSPQERSTSAVARPMHRTE